MVKRIAAKNRAEKIVFENKPKAEIAVWIREIADWVETLDVGSYEFKLMSLIIPHLLSCR